MPYKNSTLEQRRKWRQTAKKRPEYDRNLLARNLRRLYKITPEQFDAMVSAQGGVCAICKQAPAGTKRQKRLFIDHDHATGAIRALLCHLCNIGIAGFERDPRLAIEAYAYLLRYTR